MSFECFRLNFSNQPRCRQNPHTKQFNEIAITEKSILLLQSLNICLFVLCVLQIHNIELSTADDDCQRKACIEIRCQHTNWWMGLNYLRKKYTLNTIKKIVWKNTYLATRCDLIDAVFPTNYLNPLEKGIISWRNFRIGWHIEAMKKIVQFFQQYDKWIFLF